VYPAHRDKAEIMCMGSIGEKTPTEPKGSLYSSLWHIEQDNVNVYAFCSI